MDKKKRKSIEKYASKSLSMLRRQNSIKNVVDMDAIRLNEGRKSLLKSDNALEEMNYDGKSPAPQVEEMSEKEAKGLIMKAAGELSAQLRLQRPSHMDNQKREMMVKKAMMESERKRTKKEEKKATIGLLSGKESYFEGVQITKPGVTIWKIVGKSVEMLPARDFGKFYEGDAYIVVTATLIEKQGMKSRKNQVEVHVHYWLGEEASIDKFAMAAIRAVQLSAVMEPNPQKQHREVMYQESKRFIEAFAYRLEQEEADGDDIDEDDEDEVGSSAAGSPCEVVDGGALFLNSGKLAAEESEAEDEKEADVVVGRRGGIVYLEGGVESFLRKVPKKKHKIRLYRFKGKKNVRVNLVELSVKSLNSGDAFLLDAGEQLYVWFGKHSNWKERSLCAQAAVHLKHAVKRKFNAHYHTDVITLFQGTEPIGFWKALGVIPNDSKESKVPNVKIAECKEDDEESERNVNFDLYEIDLVDGQVEPTFINQDDDGSIYMSKLNGNCVYMLDAKTEIFVYVGPAASRVQVEAGLQLAIEARTYSPDEAEEEEIERPPWIDVRSMIHPYLHPMFTLKFSDWFLHIGAPPPIYNKRSSKTTKKASHRLAFTAITGKQLRKFDFGDADSKEEAKNETKVKKPSITSPMEKMLRDPEPIRKSWKNLIVKDKDSDVRIAVYCIQKSILSRVPEVKYGSFHSDRCYALVCVYTFKKSPRYCMFFWQGILAPKASYFIWHYDLLPSLEEKMFEAGYSSKPLTARILQNSEPEEFLCLFEPGIVIIEPPDLVSVPSRGRSKAIQIEDASKFKKSSTFKSRMFHITLAVRDFTRTYEVPCIAKSLNSMHSFVVQAGEEKFFIWFGSKCSIAERKLAVQSALNIYKILTDQEDEEDEDENVDITKIFTVLKETQETKEFWNSIGGKGKYANFSTISPEEAESVKKAKLFRLQMIRHHLQAVSVLDFNTRDLAETAVYILDIGCMIFVWRGQYASSRIFDAATELIKSIAKDRKDSKAVAVHQGNEPPEFTYAFLGWHEHRRFVDPYEKRMERLVDIGVVGRVISKAEIERQKKMHAAKSR